MLLVDWIRKVTIGDLALDVEDNALRVSMDTTETMNAKAETDAIRECNEEEIIKQLKIMNVHLSAITGLSQ